MGRSSTSGLALSMSRSDFKETFFRLGDRVILNDTGGSSFDFAGAGLFAGVALGTIVQLPDHVAIVASVLVEFDKWPGSAIAVDKRRLLLASPLDRLEREI